MDEVTIRLSCVEDFGGEIIVTVMGSPGQKRVRYAVGENRQIISRDKASFLNTVPQRIQDCCYHAPVALMERNFSANQVEEQNYS